jgi:hypothetical protein
LTFLRRTTTTEGSVSAKSQGCASRRARAPTEERLDAIGQASRTELIDVLRLPDFDRADAIGTFWGHPETRTFGELLIDLEEDKAARAVVCGLLAEMERK